MNKILKSIFIIFGVICVFLAIGNIIKIQKIGKKDYKKDENGNTKNIKEIEQYILNVNSYKAKIKVTVKSNKNVNFYELKQEVKANNETKQIALSPKDLEGIEISYKNGTIEVKNTKYNLTTIYKNYPYISDNSMYLTSFIEGYKKAENKEIKEVDNKIELSYETKKNKYNNKQKLYINKSTLLPENMQILNINNDTKVDILYNEIELNI